MSNHIYDNQKKIPGILLILVLLAIFSIPFLVNHKKTSNEVNLPESKPKNIKVVNLSHGEAAIFWESDQSSKGVVYISDDDNKLGERHVDEREFGDIGLKNKYHLVNVKNLRPGTLYFVRIGRGQNGSIPSQEADTSFTTSHNTILSTQSAPIIGFVANKDGSFNKGAIVIGEIEGVQPVADVTKKDGGFLLPTCCFILKKNGELASVVESTDVKFYIFDEKTGVTTHASTIAKATPLKTKIVAGVKQNIVSPTLSPYKQVLGTMEKVGLTSSPIPKVKSFDIIYPEPKAVIAAKKPIFKGVGQPNTKLSITISSKGTVENLKVDSEGVWRYMSDSNFKPGSYTVTVRGVGKSDEIAVVSRNFSIAKSGEAVLGEATPEATLKPVVTPGVTVIISATPLPEITEASSTPKPTLPQSGLGINHIGVMLIAIVLVGVGALLVL